MKQNPGARRSIEMLLLGLEPAGGRRGLWHGGPQVTGVLRGVTAARALWRPAAGRHNIWELALHVAYWKYAVRRQLTGGGEGGGRFGRSPSNWPKIPEGADEAAWQADQKLLAAEHAALVAAVREFPAGRLDEIPKAGKKWTYAELISGIGIHDHYHLGQIQLLKRLAPGPA